MYKWNQHDKHTGTWANESQVLGQWKYIYIYIYVYKKNIHILYICIYHICANRAYYIIQVYTLVDGVLYRCPGTCVMNGVGSKKKSIEHIRNNGTGRSKNPANLCFNLPWVIWNPLVVEQTQKITVNLTRLTPWATPGARHVWIYKSSCLDVGSDSSWSYPVYGSKSSQNNHCNIW